MSICIYLTISGDVCFIFQDRQSLINFVEAVKLARLASSNLQQYTAVTLPLRRNVVRFFAAANLVLFTRRVIL